MSSSQKRPTSGASTIFRLLLYKKCQIGVKYKCKMKKGGEK